MKTLLQRRLTKTQDSISEGRICGPRAPRTSGSDSANSVGDNLGSVNLAMDERKGVCRGRALLLLLWMNGRRGRERERKKREKCDAREVGVFCLFGQCNAGGS